MLFVKNRKNLSGIPDEEFQKALEFAKLGYNERANSTKEFDTKELVTSLIEILTITPEGARIDKVNRVNDLLEKYPLSLEQNEQLAKIILREQSSPIIDNAKTAMDMWLKGYNFYEISDQIGKSRQSVRNYIAVSAYSSGKQIFNSASVGINSEKEEKIFDEKMAELFFDIRNRRVTAVQKNLSSIASSRMLSEAFISVTPLEVRSHRFYPALLCAAKVVEIEGAPKNKLGHILEDVRYAYWALVGSKKIKNGDKMTLKEYKDFYEERDFKGVNGNEIVTQIPRYALWRDVFSKAVGTLDRERVERKALELLEKKNKSSLKVSSNRDPEIIRQLRLLDTSDRLDYNYGKIILSPEYAEIKKLYEDVRKRDYIREID